jgi:RNA polymerase sigma-70 factor (sigma-E family)
VGRSPQFEEFVATHGAALLRTAYLASGDADRSQDLVQGALEKALRAWPKVQRADSPLAYVRRIVVREHLSWLRTRSAGERIGLPAHHATPVADGNDTVDMRDTVWRLLATLPRQQRTVLVLRLFDDLTDNQIADALGCRPATVRAHASRGLTALRSHPSLQNLNIRSSSHD